MAALLWESTGVTNGFDLLDEEEEEEATTLGCEEALILIGIKCKPFATLRPRCFRNLTAENSRRLHRMNPQNLVLLYLSMAEPFALSF